MLVDRQVLGFLAYIAQRHGFPLMRLSVEILSESVPQADRPVTGQGKDQGGLALRLCPRCGSLWWLARDGTWRCPNCGHTGGERRMWIRTANGEIVRATAIGYSPMDPDSDRYVLDGLLGDKHSAELAGDLTREQVELILDWIWEELQRGCHAYDLRKAIGLAREARPATRGATEEGVA